MSFLLVSMLGILGMAVVLDGRGDDAPADEDLAVEEDTPTEEITAAEEGAPAEEDIAAQDEPVGTDAPEVDAPAGEDPTGEDTVAQREDAPAEEEPDAEVAEPEEVRLEGSTVLGTQGDDVIDREVLTSLSPDVDIGDLMRRLDLGAGDDFVDADAIRVSGVTIDGGAGNDTIENEGDYAEIRGNSGDDVLTSEGQADLYGEAGDDTLSVDVGAFSFSGGGLLSGGVGDDVLQVIHTLGSSNSFDGGATAMYGDAGNDEFNIELIDGVGPTFTTSGEQVTLSGDGAQVEVLDFVAGEDALAVDATSFTEGGKYALADVDLRDLDVPSSWAEGSWYALSLSFSGTGETGDFVTSIYILSEEGGVTLDDISILSGVAA